MAFFFYMCFSLNFYYLALYSDNEKDLWPIRLKICHLYPVWSDHAFYYRNETIQHLLPIRLRICKTKINFKKGLDLFSLGLKIFISEIKWKIATEMQYNF